MFKQFYIVLIILTIGIPANVAAQEQYAYVYDSSTKKDYRIRYYKTNVTVIAHAPDKGKFYDKIIALDSNGIYFYKNGFYNYKNIELIRFKPYYTVRNIFQRVYYISVMNLMTIGTFYSLHNSHDKYLGYTIILTIPLWAFVIPQGVNLIMVLSTPNEVIETKNAIFKSSDRNSPFKIKHEKFK